MGNESNLKPFTSENQPKDRRSRKGVPNRATVYKKWLETKIKIEDPKDPKGKLTVTLLEAAALGQIESARQGNTSAWKEIQDSIHGKQTDRQEITGKDGADLIPKIVVEIVNGPDKSNNKNTD